MIVPGNMRERPHGLDLREINIEVVDKVVTLCTEVLVLQGEVFELTGDSRLEKGAAFEVLDRLTVVRSEIDIIKRIIKNSTSHEIHNGD